MLHGNASKLQLIIKSLKIKCKSFVFRVQTEIYGHEKFQHQPAVTERERDWEHERGAFLLVSVCFRCIVSNRHTYAKHVSFDENAKNFIYFNQQLFLCNSSYSHSSLSLAPIVFFISPIFSSSFGYYDFFSCRWRTNINTAKKLTI